MKTSIRSKFLTMCILLVLLTTVGISATYYVLIRQDKRREFQQRIQIAFDIILDDFEARLTTSTNRVRDFLLDDTLAITSSRYAEDEERIRSISFVSTNLAKAAAELKRFGHVNAARRVLFYGANMRLLAAYLRNDEQESTGIYVQLQEGNDVYLPADDSSQLTPMLLGRNEIPDTAFPDMIVPSYDGEVPETISANLFTQDNKLGIRIIAPIVYRENFTGILLVDLCYTQSIVERYASLSQTEVNFFVGPQFNVGTLPVQTSITAESLVSCDALKTREAAIAIFPVTFEKHDYYQGQCELTGEEEALGAISISLSQEIEKQTLKNVFTAVLSISGVVFVITLGLSWIFSRRIIRPITSIATLIHQVSDGDLSGVFGEQGLSDNVDASAKKALDKTMVAAEEVSEQSLEGKDEVAILTHAFHAMAEYLQTMASIAEQISQGDIAQAVTLRSERDTLGLAFQQMLTYIRGVTELTKAISDGDLLVDVQPRSDQDVLSHSLRKMITYIQGVAEVAEVVSEGNLRVRVQPKSEQDVLNLSLQKMVQYIREVSDITERVSNNDLQVNVVPKSESDLLNMSLQRMVTNLQTAREKAEQSMEEVERQNWLKTGQAELSEAMRGEQDVAMLAKHVITYLAEYLQAQVGLLYLTEERNGEPIL